MQQMEMSNILKKIVNSIPEVTENKNTCINLYPSNCYS